jgi:hypothetical protein
VEIAPLNHGTKISLVTSKFWETPFTYPAVALVAMELLTTQITEMEGFQASRLELEAKFAKQFGTQEKPSPSPIMQHSKALTTIQHRLQRTPSYLHH